MVDGVVAGTAHQDAECGLLHYIAAASSDVQRRIAQHPLNRVFACNNCTAPGGNFFVVDQYDNIPWFVDTLMHAVQEMQRPQLQWGFGRSQAAATH